MFNNIKRDKIKSMSRSVERSIGYRFKDPYLLLRALTHQSSLDVKDFVKMSNQRLEFLGDRVLGLVIAEYLLAQSEQDAEGEIAPRLNMLVSKQACARAAKNINLGKYLLLSQQEESSGGRNKESILGDACEALIAAIYKDSNLDSARRFILKVWENQLKEISESDCVKDPKTLLQEFVQSKKGSLPVYRLVSREGPDHEPEFTIELKALGWTSIGVAFSKQEAERAAARTALRMLKQEYGEQ